MLYNYNQKADEALVRGFSQAGQWPEAFDALAQPLHEMLYETQSFDLLQSLTPVEELILSLDYVQMQVGQGGFIQLIQNGYVSLLVNVIEASLKLDIAQQTHKLLDNVLKVFVLNKEALSRETTPKEFAALYSEFAEFEPLDEAFMEQLPQVIKEAVLRVVGE